MGYLLEYTEDTLSRRKLLNADSKVIIRAGRQETVSTKLLINGINYLLVI